MSGARPEVEFPESPEFPEQADLPAGTRIRRAGESDVPALAELELRLFPEDAWSIDMVLEEIVHPSRHFVVVEQVEQVEQVETGTDAATRTIGTDPGTATRPSAIGPIGSEIIGRPSVVPEIIGYAGVMLLGDSADLHTIGTTRPGIGIGRALLTWSLRVAREGGASALLLEVREDNTRARQVYAAAGFQDIGARPGYYPSPRGPVDARVMLRELRAD